MCVDISYFFQLIFSVDFCHMQPEYTKTDFLLAILLIISSIRLSLICILNRRSKGEISNREMDKNNVK